jgi:hypothetical protein
MSAKKNIKDMSVKNFLGKDKCEALKGLNLHIGILKANIGDFISKMPELKNASPQELADFFATLPEKCNSESSEYDFKLYKEVARICLGSIRGPHNHNVFNTFNPNGEGTFEDDHFGFGTNPTSLYDDFVDIENERSMHR